MYNISKLLTILALAFLLAGCAGMNSTEQRMLSGGAIGAGAGALFGAMAGSPAAGAAIGGAAGVVGGAIVDNLERNRAYSEPPPPPRPYY